jgi:hypothetical protein
MLARCVGRLLLLLWRTLQLSPGIFMNGYRGLVGLPRMLARTWCVSARNRLLRHRPLDSVILLLAGARPHLPFAYCLLWESGLAHAGH